VTSKDGPIIPADDLEIEGRVLTEIASRGNTQLNDFSGRGRRH
jgi:hypothetical protein